MPALIGIALKSLLVAGLALGLLQLLKRRSAAERSWVAHVGLLMLAVVAFAPLVLPSWTVESPALITRAAETVPAAQYAPAIPSVATAAPVASAPRGIATGTTPERPSLTLVTAVTALYALPAAALLLITLLALVRLIALRSRADVLVDGHWLSALARAQRRMGFKHGTALLTSDELASPISWGLMRPVILLNSRAVEASGEAEAIIAHELAHVAQMDWAKLLLARIATALFWFNPLVWMLAREAHQLREEAADDAVLGADICDTDYAQLLVGVARHECPGLLLGAHGVAPSKNSLARRVARVLDGKSVRGPAARSFALGVLVGAVLVAAPLAALTLAPAGAKETKKDSPGAVAKTRSVSSYSALAADVPPTDLANIIADGVSTSVQTAVAAAQPAPQPAARDIRSAAIEKSLADAAEVRARALEQAGVAIADARRHENILQPGAIKAIQIHAAGLTPEYIGAMRALAPQFARLGVEEFAGMRAVGVTPAYARDIIAAIPSISADDLVSARAIGLTGSYIRAMKTAGVRGELDDFVQLRAVGIEPEFALRARQSGIDIRDVDNLVKLRVLGGTPPPTPPRSPAPPGGWNPGPDDG
jgi:bla regulator protein BlaR1